MVTPKWISWMVGTIREGYTIGGREVPKKYLKEVASWYHAHITKTMPKGVVTGFGDGCVRASLKGEYVDIDLYLEYSEIKKISKGAKNEEVTGHVYPTNRPRYSTYKRPSKARRGSSA